MRTEVPQNEAKFSQFPYKRHRCVCWPRFGGQARLLSPPGPAEAPGLPAGSGAQVCRPSLIWVFSWDLSTRATSRHFVCFVPDSFLRFPVGRCHAMMLSLAGVNYMKT